MRHPEMDRFNPQRLLPFAIGAGLVLFLLLGAFHVVPPGHRGISITLGKIKGEAIKSAPDVIDLEIAKRWNGVTPQSIVVGRGGANVLLPLK